MILLVFKFDHTVFHLHHISMQGYFLYIIQLNKLGSYILNTQLCKKYMSVANINKDAIFAQTFLVIYTNNIIIEQM